MCLYLWMNIPAPTVAPLQVRVYRYRLTDQRNIRTKAPIFSSLTCITSLSRTQSQHETWHSRYELLLMLLYPADHILPIPDTLRTVWQPPFLDLLPPPFRRDLQQPPLLLLDIRQLVLFREEIGTVDDRVPWVVPEQEDPNGRRGDGRFVGVLGRVVDQERSVRLVDHLRAALVG
jgi:hypothetical protein